MVQEFVFDDVETKTKKGGSFLWNSETREFLGRDGASWAKITFFYAIFYTCLASFFVGMLAVFVSFMPRDVPSYYGDASKMGIDGINPGLGFRPQVDVEDSLIMYSPLVADSPSEGNLKYIRNLKNFLDAKYGKVDNSNDKSKLVKCKQALSDEDVRDGKACDFDYASIFEKTPCTEDKSFGYQTNEPCVLLKVNKIVDWRPKNKEGGDSIFINCTGETSVDKDNVLNVKYYSEKNDDETKAGAILSKYFPYFGQKLYRAPFIWAQFSVTPNTLVNIECKAYADNIDNKDRINKRGQTKFSLFIAKN